MRHLLSTLLFLGLLHCGDDSGDQAGGNVSGSSGQGGSGAGSGAGGSGTGGGGTSGGGTSSGESGAGGTNTGGTSAGGTSGGGGGASGGGGSPVVGSEGWQRAFSKGGEGLSCEMSFEQMSGSKAPRLTFGEATMFVGFRQVGQNQDPVVARFDKGQATFCQYHETQGPDSRAHGLTWDGGAKAYVVYTTVGGGTDLEKAAKGQWLDRYGDGGGSSKVSVLGEVDTATGALNRATFLIAKKKDGKTNSHGPVDAPTVLEDGTILFLGASAFQPMNPDRTIMECTDYPFDTRYIFSADLKTLLCSSSTNCVSKAPCP